jgi:hypothetical protein
VTEPGASSLQDRVRLTVHPGLGKTATTTVQSVLRDESDLWFGGVRSHAPDHPFTRAFDALLREPLDRWTWRARTPLTDRIDALAHAVADGLRGSPSRVGVLSEEAILAHVGDDVGWRGPASGRRGGAPGWRIAGERLNRLSQTLVRVRELLAADGLTLEVAGLLTVRRHGSLLASSWAWNHEHYRSLGLLDTDDLLRLVAADGFPRLRFNSVVAAMEGAELGPVTVLPLEALAADAAAFWSALATVVGHPLTAPVDDRSANRRRTSTGGWTVRTVENPQVARIGTSAAFGRLVGPLPRGLRERLEHALRPRSADGGRLHLDDAVLGAIDAAYADDLPLLSPHCPFDLGALGYSAPGAGEAVS